MEGLARVKPFQSHNYHSFCITRNNRQGDSKVSTFYKHLSSAQR